MTQRFVPPRFGGAPSKALSVILGLAALVTGCESGSPPASHGAARAPAKRTGPRLLRAPESTTNVAAFVKSEISRAKPNEKVLVYIGAPWCEPCVHFHEALEEGRLDSTFPNVTVLEFDADKDRAALEKDGYSWQMLPFFVVPGPDGRASRRSLAGSIKGAEAVEANLVPRLQQLLQLI
jgi:thiol-disulfide isomerase/thioredoxin